MMVTPTRKLLNLIRERFQEHIAVKTGWGKNELMAEYDKAVSEALIDMLDEPSPVINQPQFDYKHIYEHPSTFNPSFIPPTMGDEIL